MGFLKENSLRLFLLFFAIVAFYFIGKYLSVNGNFYNRMLKIRIEEQYSGVVLEKYIDYSQHSTPKLKLTDSEISLENTFWNDFSVGDSIVKLKGKSYITLYTLQKQRIIFDYKDYFKNLIERKKYEKK